MKGKALQKEINDALANPQLQAALGKFCGTFPDARARAYESRDFPALRQEIAAIKRRAAENLEELVEEFVKCVTARGATVFRAATAEDARAYILNLARAKGIRTIVKSKSMATEEIHLNAYLAAHGLDVVETDLGERILQLSGAHPSHMVMPAIHLTKEQVAGIFSRETGEEIPADIPALVKVARRLLRERFLAAGMGISGVNIAVASTGTIVIVSNEGNARLTTTLPPIHVAVVGLEKIVPGLEDVAPILEALPRSATAQHITSYVTMITGPTPAIDAQGREGLKELHIVLLDNGRTALYNDPVFREAWQCIRCASCLNVCPVFEKVGGHVFGHVYTGGIGLILTAFFHGLANAEGIGGLCIGCGRCREFCPAGIDIPRLVLELRRRLVEERGLPWLQKVLLERVMLNRGLFHTLIRAAAVAQKPYKSRDGLIRHLPLWFAGLTEGRALPAVADVPLRRRPGREGKPANPRTRVAFFAGCLVDFVYPELGEAARKVLNALGVDVVFPLGQTCCGYPFRYAGAADTAALLARQNIAALEAPGAAFVLTPCPTCAVALKHEYPALLAGDPAFTARARALAARVVDFSSFVLAHWTDGLVRARGGVVTFHDSCHLRRSLGVYEEPRVLLARAGYTLREMAMPDRCCGFGGSYALKFPAISRSLLDDKIDDIAGSGAATLVTDCPGCLLQIRSGLAVRKPGISAQHTAELLAGNLPS
ncbi:MAG: L-lactate dehydrogenase (quinone) large subunit LdhH [Desulfotomaculales bacterium]